MTASSPTRPPSPLWARCLLATISPVVFVLLVEAGVRLSGLDTDLARNDRFEIAVPAWLLADPGWVDIQRGRLERPRGVAAADVAWLRHFEEARYIQYRLKPRVDVAAVNPFNDFEVDQQISFRLTSNSAGFREREFTAKTPAVIRIVSIGDSSTFGWGVDPEYTYQRLLERRLRGLGRHVEVLNLGMPGFDSTHGLRVLEHYALPLDPDLLVIGFGANDARFGLQPTESVLAPDDTWRGVARTAALRLESFKLLRRLLVTLSDPFESHVDAARASGRPLVRAVPPEAYARNLERMTRLALAAGAESVFLAVCAPGDYVSVMREVAVRRQVPMIDGLQIFLDRLDEVRARRVYASETAYYERIYGTPALEENWRLHVTSDGCHPNRVGHSLLADALADAVVDALARRTAGGG